MNVQLNNLLQSSSATKFFTDVLSKKGYVLTGKSINIQAENKVITKDLTAAGNFFLIKNSSVAPIAANFDNFYHGDVRIKIFVQAFTSGTLDRECGFAQIDNAGASVLTPLIRKSAIGAVETGLPVDNVNLTEIYLQNVTFNDIYMTYGAGASPIGTIRAQINFIGQLITLS